MTDSGAGQPSRMAPYDAQAWASVSIWRQRRGERESRKLLPYRFRTRLAATGCTAKNKLDGLPGAERFEQLFSDAMRGLTDVGARAARVSVRRDAVVRAYQKRGHAVASLTDIRKLGLADIDTVKPRLDLAYIASSMVEGAAAGFNARLLAKAAGDADHLYRERFLRERYGLDVTTEDVAGEDGDTVPVSDIVDAETVDGETE